MYSYYKLELILIYLNTVKKEYTYKEMTEFMGLCYDKIDDIIDYLKNRGLIYKDEYCIIKISDNGKSYLYERGLLDINFYNLYSGYKVDESIIYKTIGINDIYIPKKFKKYFNGYNK